MKPSRLKGSMNALCVSISLKVLPRSLRMRGRLENISPTQRTPSTPNGIA
jgi:hypothetical protein